jgi:hypothetical protein
MFLIRKMYDVAGVAVGVRDNARLPIGKNMSLHFVLQLLASSSLRWPGVRLVQASRLPSMPLGREIILHFRAMFGRYVSLQIFGARERLRRRYLFAFIVSEAMRRNRELFL